AYPLRLTKEFRKTMKCPPRRSGERSGPWRICATNKPNEQMKTFRFSPFALATSCRSLPEARDSLGLSRPTFRSTDHDISIMSNAMENGDVTRRTERQELAQGYRPSICLALFEFQSARVAARASLPVVSPHP